MGCLTFREEHKSQRGASGDKRHPQKAKAGLAQTQRLHILMGSCFCVLHKSVISKDCFLLAFNLVSISGIRVIIIVSCLGRCRSVVCMLKTWLCFKEQRRWFTLCSACHSHYWRNLIKLWMFLFQRWSFAFIKLLRKRLVWGTSLVFD